MLKKKKRYYRTNAFVYARQLSDRFEKQDPLKILSFILLFQKFMQVALICRMANK